MVTFLSDTVMHKYNWAPIERKQNKLAVNTEVLGLFLRHYFVDSNIRNL